MPVVNGKHFPYTTKGKAAARKFKKKPLGAKLDFISSLSTGANKRKKK